MNPKEIAQLVIKKHKQLQINAENKKIQDQIKKDEFGQNLFAMS